MKSKVLPPSQYFQEKYLREREPWYYSFRAAEILRHQAVVETVRRLQEETGSRHLSVGYQDYQEGDRKIGVRILDIGCSMGQLTRELRQCSEKIFALDISEMAVRKAKVNCQTSSPFNPNPPSSPLSSPHPHPLPKGAGERVKGEGEGDRVYFLVGSSVALPFVKESFEIIVLSDGLQEWQLSDSEKKSTFREVNRLLVKGGKAIFTDYLKPSDFDLYVQTIAKSPLKILEVRSLYDRLWYQFESLFKAIRHWRWVREILSCLWTAKFLRILSMLFGKYGSRHILVVAEKI